MRVDPAAVSVPVPRHLRPAVHCTAKRTDGGRCGCWAMHGQQVCHAHGGRAAQNRRAAWRRLQLAAAEAYAAGWLDLDRTLTNQRTGDARRLLGLDRDGELAANAKAELDAFEADLAAGRVQLLTPAEGAQ